MIVSRPARLLECLEFDPGEFLQLLGEAEARASREEHSARQSLKQSFAKLKVVKSWPTLLPYLRNYTTSNVAKVLFKL